MIPVEMQGRWEIVWATGERTVNSLSGSQAQVSKSFPASLLARVIEEVSESSEH